MRHIEPFWNTCGLGPHNKKRRRQSAVEDYSPIVPSPTQEPTHGYDSDDLEKVVFALQLGRKARRISRQNPCSRSRPWRC